MKYVTLAICTIYLSSCASTPPSNFQAVTFSSLPEGAALTVYEPKSENIIATCMTPCSLQIDVNKTQAIKVLKNGYEPRIPKKPDFPIIRSPFFPKGYVGTNMRIEIKLYTPEEAIIKKEEDAKKALAYKQKRALKGDKADYVDIARAEGVQDNPDDKDAQPLVRGMPHMPVSIEKSGHCIVKFDVMPEGQTTLIHAVKCSDKMFEKPSVNTVKHWIYAPKLINGQKMRRYGVQTKITFRLMDSKGKVIPE